MADGNGVKRARELVERNENEIVDRARPSYVTANPRGEPRELLKQFHFNYPFVGVQSVPRVLTYYSDNSDDIQVSLPDGTIWISFCSDGGNFAVSFDGRVPDLWGAPVNGVLIEGVIIDPDKLQRFLVYPNKSVNVRADGNLISILCYISAEQSQLRNG